MPIYQTIAQIKDWNTYFSGIRTKLEGELGNLKKIIKKQE